MNSCERALYNAETEIEKLMAKPRIIVTGREAFSSLVAANKIYEEMRGCDERKLESHPKSYKRLHVDIYGNKMSIP